MTLRTWPYLLDKVCSMNTPRFLYFRWPLQTKKLEKYSEGSSTEVTKEMAFRGGAHWRPGYSHMTKFPGILFWVFVLDLSCLVPSSQTVKTELTTLNRHECRRIFGKMAF